MLFFNEEEVMILRVFLGLIIGGLAGFLLSYFTRGVGSA
jgi:uncharacterized membrane protein YraQ (UPF0718 family)